MVDDELGGLPELRVEVLLELGDVEPFDLDLRWNAEQIQLLERQACEVAGQEGKRNEG